jgi:hypothetical protein
MWREDAGPRDAERLGRLHELLPLERERLAADDAGHVEPFGRADGDEDQTIERPKNTTSMITKKMKGSE